jgi:tetratricopeptide (TPR) repeat protein
VLNPSWHHLAPAWITWIVPAALASAAALARVRELTAAALIFFFALLPVLGLHPFVFQLYSTVADRYVYLAMLGPALALSWACNRFPAPAVLLAAVAGLACCSAISFRQAGRWHDTASLCRQAVLVNPRDYRAYHNLGLYLADRGDVLGAMNAYQKVIDLKPQAVAEYRYVADAKAAAADFNGALDYAGRLIDLQSALIPADRGDPGELHRWRAGIYLQSARAAGSGSAQAQTAYRNAVDDCDESLRRNPGDASAAAERAAALAGLRDMGVAP